MLSLLLAQLYYEYIVFWQPYEAADSLSKLVMLIFNPYTRNGEEVSILKRKDNRNIFVAQDSSAVLAEVSCLILGLFKHVFTKFLLILLHLKLCS